MAKLQQERKGILGNRIRGVRRNVAYRDMPFRSRDGIHHVKAGSQHADHTQVRMTFDHFSGDNGFVGQHDLSVRHTFCRFRRFAEVINGQLAQLFQFRPAQVARVFRVTV